MSRADTQELREIKILAEGLEFPEGPIALADGSVLVVEIVGGRLTRIATDGTKSVVAQLGDGPNGAAIGPDGWVYVCNNGGMTPDASHRGRIQKVNIETGEFHDLYTECDGHLLTAPNDIVFDTDGGFWFTDLGGNAIYYAQPDGSAISCPLPQVDGPNGIGLSPDGTVLYWSETHTRMVHRRRITAPGVLEQSPGHGVHAFFRESKFEEWTLVTGLPGAMGLDSLAVDADGNVLVGTLIHSGITEVNTANGSFKVHSLPESVFDHAVTNICFGGPDMQTAFITLSLTGRLISCRWPRPGLRLNFNA